MTEYFSKLLNTPPPNEKPDIQESAEDLDIDTGPPKKEETVVAVQSLKTSKAPGHDNLNGELFKAESKVLVATLQSLI